MTQPIAEMDIPISPSNSSTTKMRGAARRLVSIQEAADFLGVSIASVRRLIWQGQLPVVRLTRRIQIDIHDLNRLIDQRKEAKPF